VYDVSYIFTKTQCKKSEIYDFILVRLLENGWKNISSSKADGDVMYSTGILGDRELYIQMFPYDPWNPTTRIVEFTKEKYDNNHIQKLDTNNYFSICLCDYYKPGLENVVGTRKRSNQMVIAINVCNSTTVLRADTIFDIYYYCDKNKLIIDIKSPKYFSGDYSQFIYLGQPDTLYLSGKDSRNVLCAASAFTAENNNSTDLIGNYILLSNYPSKFMQNYGDMYTATISILEPNITPNTEGVFLLHEPYYWTAGSGIVGKMDGIYVLPANANVNRGDIITVGKSEFFVIKAFANVNHSSFNNRPIAIQIQ
jgi:hypothetical protein